jgi:hypothetical protein
MKKLDLKARYKEVYKAPAKGAVVVDVPALAFLMAHGEGDPNTAPAYKQAVAALFSLAYTLKFLIKKGELGIDYGVMPLEGLWWTEGGKPFHRADRKAWKWTAMILQPDFVDAPLVEEARAAAAKKKGLPGLADVKLETFREGRSAQILHRGPYSAEGPKIEALHQFIADQGGRPHGRHHEIYLGDPTKTAPDKLKTILRQPFQ